MSDIFEPRVNFKPFEYPEVMAFIDAMNRSYWTEAEVPFTADVQEFHTQLSTTEQNTIKRSVLAIAQIEVSVKTFWGELYNNFPKPEINAMGATFSESEVRHSFGYAKLIEALGLDEEFETLLEVPAIKDRVDYLESALIGKRGGKKDYILSLLLFSVLIENVSLFSQFATVLAFNRFKGVMKNTANIIAWTAHEETIHGDAGMWIINTILKENPDLLTKEDIDYVYEQIAKSVRAEEKILDWMFQDGDLDILTKKQVLQFIKHRANISLETIDGLEPVFEVSEKDKDEMFWFTEEVSSVSSDDFFTKRPVDYTKNDKPITEDDLF